MKAGLIMSAPASLKPAPAYHPVWGGTHARNRLNGPARSTPVCMGTIVAVVLASCMAAGVILLADCGVTPLLRNVTPHVVWMAL